ncbi:MAG TPA: hypothetical protein VKY89_19180 [Thermoanaerobaculia bacterium]|nr:hypothetical protein [Thermoanaerobaculia bacterium]
MTGELAGGLGAVALFAVPGYGLTELFPTLRRLRPPLRLAYGYLLGVAAVAGALFALSHVAGVPLRPPAVWASVGAPALAGLAAGLWRRHRRRAARAPSPTSARRAAPRGSRFGRLVPAACALAAATICLGVFAEALINPPHDWDGRMTWCAQARYIRAAGTVDAPVLREVSWDISHPQYPLLMPVAQVAALEAFGADPDSHLPRAIYAAFLPALLLVIHAAARRGAGPVAAAVATLAAAAAPFMILGEGGAESTYSDLPLGCFYGAGLALLLGARPRAESGLAAGLLLAAAALTKNEGAPLACLALALGWRSGRAGVRRFAAAALPLVLALALFASWRAGVPNREDEGYPQLLYAGGFWSGIAAHAQAAVPVMVDKMNRFRHWAGFWWMVPAALLAGRRALGRPIARRWLAAAAGPPAIALLAYSIHPRPAYLAAVTWERFLLQATVPLLVLLAYALAEVGRHLAGSSRRQGDGSVPLARST